MTHTTADLTRYAGGFFGRPRPRSWPTKALIGCFCIAKCCVDPLESLTMLRVRLLTVAALLIVWPHWSSAQRGGYRPEVGQPHSDFLLPSIETRQPVSLSQFRGKKVLLIHFASW